jgi:hypothetical protein
MLGLVNERMLLEIKFLDSSSTNIAIHHFNMFFQTGCQSERSTRATTFTFIMIFHPKFICFKSPESLILGTLDTYMVYYKKFAVFCKESWNDDFKDAPSVAARVFLMNLTEIVASESGVRNAKQGVMLFFRYQGIQISSEDLTQMDATQSRQSRKLQRKTFMMERTYIKRYCSESRQLAMVNVAMHANVSTVIIPNHISSNNERKANFWISEESKKGKVM